MRAQGSHWQAKPIRMRASGRLRRRQAIAAVQAIAGTESQKRTRLPAS